MRIAHMSDLHYSGGNLVEADRCFGFAVEDAIRRNVEVAVISGDSTDHRLDAHAPALLALARRIKQLADHCPVFMLQGTFSHEPAGMLHMFALIGAKHPIVISDRIEMIALSRGKWIEYDPVHPEDSYELVITSVPTVNKADLVSTVGAENASEAMGDHLAAILASFGGVNGHLREQGVPTVLVSHGTVDGSLNESGVPMAGLDHEFRLGSLYSANCDAVMLGHIHKHQSWERTFNGVHQVIAYPGSIGRFHYGEIDEKYYLDWNVTSNGTVFEPVVTPSKRMIDLDFTGVPHLEELATVAKQCEGAYVRVRYEVDEEYAKTVDRNAIKEVLAGAAEVKIEGQILTVQRQRCAGISRLPSLTDRFSKWAELSDTPMEGLAERLAMLQTLEPEEIAASFAKRKAVAAAPGSVIEPDLPKPASLPVADELADLLLATPLHEEVHVPF